MQWLDMVLSLTAAASFGLASLNSVALWIYTRQATTRSRKVGASALLLVNAGLVLEALLFLSQAPPAGTWTRLAAQALVRGVLVAATALLFALIRRATSGLR